MPPLKFYIPVNIFLPPVEGASNRCLVIKDDLIGDLIHISGIVRLLGERYDTFLVVKEEFVCLASLFLKQDNIIPINTSLYVRSVRYRFLFLSQLRKLNFNLAIGSILHSSLNNDVLRYCGAKFKWAYLRKGTCLEKFRLTGINTVDAIKEKVSDNLYAHVLEHESHFLSEILGDKVEVDQITPLLNKTEYKSSYQPEGIYFIYLYEARDSRRVYPSEIMLKILGDISAKYGLKILVAGIKGINIKGSLINITGKTTLLDILSLIQNSTGVIGSESGLTHFSWVNGIKTFMTLGGGHFGRYLPIDSCDIYFNSLSCYGCGWDCIYNDNLYPCCLYNRQDVVYSIENFIKLL